MFLLVRFLACTFLLLLYRNEKMHFLRLDWRVVWLAACTIKSLYLLFLVSVSIFWSCLSFLVVMRFFSVRLLIAQVSTELSCIAATLQIIFKMTDAFLRENGSRYPVLPKVSLRWFCVIATLQTLLTVMHFSVGTLQISWSCVQVSLHRWAVTRGGLSPEIVEIITNSRGSPRATLAVNYEI